MKNRITVKICSQEYSILAVEPEEYMMRVASNVDRKMTEIMEQNHRLSLAEAAVLTSINLCDDYLKAQGTSDNLRSQIKQYLDDAAKYRQEADDAKKEIVRLRNEIQDLKIKFASSPNERV